MNKWMGGYSIVILSFLTIGGCNGESDAEYSLSQGEGQPQGYHTRVSEDVLGFNPRTANILPPGQLGVPVPRLADAHYLTSRYKKIFNYLNPRNRGTCWACVRHFLGLNPQYFFTPDENVALGQFQVRQKYFWTSPNAQNLNIDEINGEWKYSSFDQGYMKTLRDALSESCQYKIQLETDNPTEGQNLFIRQSLSRDLVPQFHEVHHVMNVFFGYKPTLTQYHYGVDKYINSYATSREEFLTATPNPSATVLRNFIQRNFIYMCVALGTDPRVWSL